MKRILSFVLCAVMLLSCVAVTSFAADDAVDAVISQIDAIGEVKYRDRTEAEVKPALHFAELGGWNWSRPYLDPSDYGDKSPWKLTLEFSFDSYVTGQDYIPNFGFGISNVFYGYRFDQQRWVVADGGSGYGINSTLGAKAADDVTRFDQILLPGVVYKVTFEADEGAGYVYLNDEMILKYDDHTNTTWQHSSKLAWFNSAYCTVNIFSMTHRYEDDAEVVNTYTPDQIKAGEAPINFEFFGDKVSVNPNTQTYTAVDSGEAIAAAENAYAALTAEQKAAVTNYGKLLAARATYTAYDKFDAIDVDAAFDAATIVTPGATGMRYALSGTGAQISIGGDREDASTFGHTIIANGRDIDFSGDLMIESIDEDMIDSAGLHFGGFSQMYGYNLPNKTFYVGGAPWSGAGDPAKENTVVAAGTEITEGEWHTFRMKVTAPSNGESLVQIWLDGKLVLKYSKCTDSNGLFYLDARGVAMTWKNVTATSGSTSFTANFESTNANDWLFTLMDENGVADSRCSVVNIPDSISYDRSKLLDVAKAYKVVSKSIAKVPAENASDISNLDEIKAIGEKLLGFVDPAQLANDLDQQDIADAIVTAANADAIYNAFSDDDKAKVDALREALYMAQEGKFLNTWTTELSIEGWEEGKGEAAPVAVAAYGAVTFTYSTAADGEYSAEAPTAAGKYFVKATVAETKAYSGLESDPVEFEITAKSVTLGDLNNDGEVNAKDLIILIRVNAGWEIDYNNDAADMNADGSINMKDIILLINAIK